MKEIAAVLPPADGFYEGLPAKHLSALWRVSRNLVRPELKSKAVPMQWRYDDVRPLLTEAGELVTTEEVDRRVLVLDNPGLPGQSQATGTLYAGVQMILPGETAPAHRHTISALRFILEGEGAFTAVEGEETQMRKGDFVITPAWAFHDHGSSAAGPCLWLDGLDIPISRFFEQAIIEEHGNQRQARDRPPGHSAAKFGQGMVPFAARSPFGHTTPLLNYPFARAREALLGFAAGEQPDPHVGYALRYANPIDGGWALPTMAVWMTYLPAGFETLPVRSSDGMVMAVSQGAGRVVIDGAGFDFGENDIHAIPSWCWRSFRADEDCFLFFFSDRAAQEKLGLFKETLEGRA